MSYRWVDLVVAGCPRSGTTYLAQVLNACGLQTFKEHYYTPLAPNMAGIAFRYHDTPFAEVSPAAYAYRRAIRPSTLVLHLVRDPIDCIQSMYETGHCTWHAGWDEKERPNHTRWDRMYYRAVDGDKIAWSSNRLDRCAQFWYTYNKRIEEWIKSRKRPGWTVQVEKVDVSMVASMFREVGYGNDMPLDKAEEIIATTSKTINSLRADERENRLAWSDLTDKQKQLAGRYGYRC